jgi:hypothetical protein
MCVCARVVPTVMVMMVMVMVVHDSVARPAMRSTPSQPVGVAEVVGFKQHIV